MDGSDYGALVEACQVLEEQLRVASARCETWKALVREALPLLEKLGWSHPRHPAWNLAARIRKELGSD